MAYPMPHTPRGTSWVAWPTGHPRAKTETAAEGDSSIVEITEVRAEIKVHSRGVGLNHASNRSTGVRSRHLELVRHRSR